MRLATSRGLWTRASCHRVGGLGAASLKGVARTWADTASGQEEPRVFTEGTEGRTRSSWNSRLQDGRQVGHVVCRPRWHRLW